MNSSEVIRRYLQDAIAAASSFENQLRSFSSEGDDEEVRALFSLHAGQAHLQYKQLTDRLEQLGGGVSTAKDLLAHLFSTLPKLARHTQRAEERTAQDLVTAFALAQGGCGIYQALATVAQAAGDSTTETLAREFEAQQRELAGKIWRFIPSRAKIAFNMLTPQEIDPAIETKAADDRILT